MQPQPAPYSGPERPCRADRPMSRNLWAGRALQQAQIPQPQADLMTGSLSSHLSARPSGRVRLRRLLFSLAVAGATALVAASGAWALSTSRVSVSSREAQARGLSTETAISATGRYVAFRSYARNLVSGGNGFGQVFVRDRRRGITRQASLTSRDRQPNGSVSDVAISGDGRYVAFASSASNIVRGDSNRHSIPGDTQSERADDIFVRDLWRGTTRRVSISSAERQANEQSYFTAISRSGRYVAFTSEASNLVPGDTNRVADVFVRDRRRGVTRRVSLRAAAGQADGQSGASAISADGRFVTFSSSATNLVAGDTNARADIFVRDRWRGTTRRVSLGSEGAQANSGSRSPVISADGRRVAFVSDASNLVAGDHNVHLERESDETLPPTARPAFDVFVRDLEHGTTRRLSVSSGGGEGDDDSLEVALSPDGRFVAFSSWATNLVARDTNGLSDIFVHDLARGTTRRASVGRGGQARYGSGTPSVSDRGRYVAFDSVADNLVRGDTNDTTDVFVRGPLLP